MAPESSLAIPCSRDDPEVDDVNGVGVEVTITVEASFGGCGTGDNPGNDNDGATVSRAVGDHEDGDAVGTAVGVCVNECIIGAGANDRVGDPVLISNGTPVGDSSGEDVNVEAAAIVAECVGHGVGIGVDSGNDIGDVVQLECGGCSNGASVGVDIGDSDDGGTGCSLGACLNKELRLVGTWLGVVVTCWTVAVGAETDISPVVGKPSIPLIALKKSCCSFEDAPLVSLAISSHSELNPPIIASTFTDPASNITFTSRVSTDNNSSTRQEAILFFIASLSSSLKAPWSIP
jgi:hypothetical protein